VTSEDSFVPLGPAAATVLLDEDRIDAAALRLLRDATGVEPRRAGTRHSPEFDSTGE
jgi:2-oxoisovalerate dehydrogenase E1 component